MPYIKKELRAKFDLEIENLIDKLINDVPTLDRDGCINYIITRVVAGGIPGNNPEWRYSSIVRAIGTFECAKQELYDRIGRVRENEAIKNNGDIKEYKEYK